jgi:hypothetical protein
VKTNNKSYITKDVQKLDAFDIKSQYHPVLTKIALGPESTAYTHSHHSVTFAPIVDNRLPSPVAYNRNHLIYNFPYNKKLQHCDYPLLYCSCRF